MNIEQQAVFGMAEVSNVAASVTLLQSRLDYLGDPWSMLIPKRLRSLLKLSGASS